MSLKLFKFEPDLQNNMNDSLSWLHNDANLSMSIFLHGSNYGNDKLFYEALLNIQYKELLN